MLRTIIKKIPAVSAIIAERDSLLKAQGFVPPGHFYSPIVSIPEVMRDEDKIFKSTSIVIPGVDMNEREQLRLLDQFESIYPTIDFPENKTDGKRYFYQNPAYTFSDAIILHCMMRHFKPRRVIEIGSGYSSCALLDTNERFLESHTSFSFIEPYPELVKSLIFPDDLKTVKIVEARLQDVEIDFFNDLEADDFLFVDSTHVCKTGSDVNHLLFNILPSLNSGVHIHIHDVFYPFEYPKEWILEGRSWNEIYALRAFLQFNSQFEVEFMNTYLEAHHESRFSKRMPLCLKNLGGSIWLRKR